MFNRTVNNILILEVLPIFRKDFILHLMIMCESLESDGKLFGESVKRAFIIHISNT